MRPLGKAEDVEIDAVAMKAMAARTERKAFTEETDGDEVVSRAPMRRQRHLMRSLAIDLGFAEFTFAIDHHTTRHDRSMVAARARSYLPGQAGERSRELAGGVKELYQE